jgi:hypothetical protein
MDTSIRKTIAYILILLVLLFTTLSILGIWEVINLDYLVRKLALSLLVIFASSAVVLFIFSVLVKDPDQPRKI